MAVMTKGLTLRTGVYHSVSEAHLHRYLTEFDFRYNNRSGLGCKDGERTVCALRGVAGKRLAYSQPRSPAAYKEALGANEWLISQQSPL